jgi:hypothetical protein
LGDSARQALAGLCDLAEHHAELARAELERDARGLSTDVALAGAGLGLAAVGYGFFCAGLAIALARPLGAVGAAVVVGALNGLIGAGCWAAGFRRLSQRHLLDDTRVQVRASMREIAASLGGERPPLVEDDPL